jgi:hypothetical protein
MLKISSFISMPKKLIRRKKHYSNSKGGVEMDFEIEALEEVSPKHPCSDKPFKAWVAMLSG